MRSSRSVRGLRAGWVVQAAVGWVMTHEDVDGVCAISVTTKVYSLVNATVTTRKESAVTSPEV